MSIFNCSEDPVITRFYCEGDTPEVTRNVVEILDEISIEGENLDFDNTDPECGVYISGAMGSIKLTELVEHRDNKIVAVIPDFMKTGDYYLEVRRKNEEGCNFDCTYERKIYVKSYVDVFHSTQEDRWYNFGIQAGKKEVVNELLEWMEQRGLKQPDVKVIRQEPQKKTVVVHRK